MLPPQQNESFPLTRHSVILAAQSGDPSTRSRALETIGTAYWKPIYKYVRMKWRVPADDAADFTQDFFARLLEKEFLDSYDSRKGRLRTFLRICADRLFMNQRRDSARQKRGASTVHLSLDFEGAEKELAAIASADSPDDYFDKEWTRSLFALGLQQLRAVCKANGKMLHFELFERYDLDDSELRPSYAELAEQFQLTSTDVTNYLAYARREFRRCVLEQLREMTGSDDEFRREAQALLGTEAP